MSTARYGPTEMGVIRVLSLFLKRSRGSYGEFGTLDQLNLFLARSFFWEVEFLKLKFEGDKSGGRVFWRECT